MSDDRGRKLPHRMTIDAYRALDERERIAINYLMRDADTIGAEVVAFRFAPEGCACTLAFVRAKGDRAQAIISGEIECEHIPAHKAKLIAILDGMDLKTGRAYLAVLNGREVARA